MCKPYFNGVLLFFILVLDFGAMGASPDGKGNVGMASTSGEKFANGTDLNMDIDEDDDVFDELVSVQELGEEFLRNFCRKAAVSFFNQYGLISHQINSYNDFIKYGLQNTFDSFGEFVIHSGYDPSKKGEGDWRHARVKFGKVTVERPTFWAVTGGNELNMLPRHARLQNMTYSSRMKVTVELQVSKYQQQLKLLVISMSRVLVDV